MNNHKSDTWFDFDYAFLSVVPHVHVGASEVVGVILHSRTSGFIGMKFDLDRDLLSNRWPDLDIDIVQRELDALDDIAKGGQSAGSIGLLPPSERFHWMTAPRSAVVQPSEVHAGRTKNPAKTLEDLFLKYI